jgi:hypothetical protein
MGGTALRRTKQMMSAGVLDHLPPWATTGVGSLPHTIGATAAAHAVKAYALPFCPQLPHLEGDMIGEWLGAASASCGWSPDRDRQRPRAWDALLRELQRRPPEHGIVKLQVTGPLSLACALEYRREALATPTELADLAREVALWLAANVAEQIAVLERHISIRQLAKRISAILLVVDQSREPLTSRGRGRPWRAWCRFRAVTVHQRGPGRCFDPHPVGGSRLDGRTRFQGGARARRRR